MKAGIMDFGDVQKDDDSTLFPFEPFWDELNQLESCW